MTFDRPVGAFFFQPGGSPYSSGVRAMDGHRIVHVTLLRPLPMADGIAAIARYLEARKRPPQALCAMKLRCPRPYSFDGFSAFNDEYCGLLDRYDMLSEGPNAVARTNIAPLLDPPAGQLVHAFGYTVPDEASDAPPSVVISGAGELVEASLDPNAIVRRGETSAEALRDKATLVMDIMESRLKTLGVDWEHVTVLDIYTVHDISSFLHKIIVQRMGASGRLGVHWYLSRPPVEEIEFEMDMRGITEERYEVLA